MTNETKHIILQLGRKFLLLAVVLAVLDIVYRFTFYSKDRDENCTLMPYSMKPVKENLGLPETVVPYAVVPIGYPSNENTPKDKWDVSRIHHDRW